MVVYHFGSKDDLITSVMDEVLGYEHEKFLNNLFPRTPLEVAIWFVVSFMAGGFCEELVFRGYIQSQLLALSRRTWIAIIGQACIFGLFHIYQGWRPVITITVLGALFGILAAWRKNLRIGMIAHGWQDFWSGWLLYLISR
jgi:membrane protease YdiL (CAAX protease family)